MHDSSVGKCLPSSYKQIGINGNKYDKNNYHTDDIHETMFLGCKDNETGEKIVVMIVIIVMVVTVVMVVD